jgi:hypothetical protein
MEQSPLFRRSNTHHSEVMKYCVTSYLKDIKGAQNELERVLERYLKVSDPLQGIDYSTNLGVDTSCVEHSVDDLINRLDAWQCYIDVLEQVQEKVKHAKTLVRGVKYGEFLWQHYVQGVKWSVIATQQHVDISTMRRRKSKAIHDLYYIMPEEYRRYCIPNATTQ